MNPYVQNDIARNLLSIRRLKNSLFLIYNLFLIGESEEAPSYTRWKLAILSAIIFTKMV